MLGRDGRSPGPRYGIWAFLPTKRKPKGAAIGTSIASRVARRHLDFKIEKDILPTLTLGSVRRLKILWTRNIGVFVGRTVPIIGEVILAYDVSVIGYRSAVHYNGNPPAFNATQSMRADDQSAADRCHHGAFRARLRTGR
ncbi:hypothetical protein [Paraburkholderia sp. NMBU_R16]|uniref:hypothetical protein n=1 Tax=Paraburkholderia sp. NMBU_R16 TaxID=2698676 RepID=UPI00349F4E9A